MTKTAGQCCRLHASLRPSGCRDGRQAQPQGGKSTRTQEAQGRGGEMAPLLERGLRLSLGNRPVGLHSTSAKTYKGTLVQDHIRGEISPKSLTEGSSCAVTLKTDTAPMCHPQPPDAFLPRRERPLAPAT